MNRYLMLVLLMLYFYAATGFADAGNVVPIPPHWDKEHNKERYERTRQELAELWRNDTYIKLRFRDAPLERNYLEYVIATELFNTSDITVLGRFIANAPNGAVPLDYPEDGVLMQFQVDEAIRGIEGKPIILLRVPKKSLHRPEYDIPLEDVYANMGETQEFFDIHGHFIRQYKTHAAVKIGEDSYLVCARKHPVGNYYDIPFLGKYVYSRKQYEAIGLEHLRNTAASQRWKDFIGSSTLLERRERRLGIEREAEQREDVRRPKTQGWIALPLWD